MVDLILNHTSILIRYEYTFRYTYMVHIVRVRVQIRYTHIVWNIYIHVALLKKKLILVLIMDNTQYRTTSAYNLFNSSFILKQIHFPFWKQNKQLFIMSVSFWSLVDSCLIGNHTISSFLYANQRVMEICWAPQNAWMCGILYHYFDFKKEHDGSKSFFEIYGPFWLLWNLTDTEWKSYLCFIDICKGNLNIKYRLQIMSPAYT